MKTKTKTKTKTGIKVIPMEAGGCPTFDGVSRYRGSITIPAWEMWAFKERKDKSIQLTALRRRVQDLEAMLRTEYYFEEQTKEK